MSEIHDDDVSGYKNGAVMTEADIRFLQVMACNYPAWFDETAASV